MSSKKTSSKTTSKKKVAKRKVGRPSTYKPEYCDVVLDIMRQGGTIAYVASELGTSRSVIYQWASKNPEFAAALEKGRELTERWWTQFGLAGMRGEYPKFAQGAWVFAMKNICKWTDRQEISGPDGKPIRTESTQRLPQDQVDAIVKAVEARHGKQG